MGSPVTRPSFCSFQVVLLLICDIADASVRVLAAVKGSFLSASLSPSTKPWRCFRLWTRVVPTSTRRVRLKTNAGRAGSACQLVLAFSMSGLACLNAYV